MSKLSENNVDNKNCADHRLVWQEEEEEENKEEEEEEGASPILTHIDTRICFFCI